jgi:hypothetical protein
MTPLKGADVERDLSVFGYLQTVRIQKPLLGVIQSDFSREGSGVQRSSLNTTREIPWG